MNTYAPSLTKSFAVANPIPSVPPVTTAILPSSLGDIFSPLLLSFAEFSTLRCFHRSPRAPCDRFSAVSISAAESSASYRSLQSEHRLAEVIGQMVRAAQQDGEPIARSVFGEIFFRYGSVPQQP